jgi:hypothetical protein
MMRGMNGRTRTPRTPGATRRVYRSIRDLHLYAGLFASPFVLLYAASAILLNHAWLPWGGRAAPAGPTRVVRVRVTDGEDGLAVARQVRAQAGVVGEIGFVRRKAGSPRLAFPVESPGRVAEVRVDLAAGTATVERRDTGAWDALVWLHRMPGPHNASIRGNWAVTRAWRWLADGTVYLLLFLSATGIYLWTLLRADRKAGLLCLGAGAVSFAAIVLALLP